MATPRNCLLDMLIDKELGPIVYQYLGVVDLANLQQVNKELNEDKTLSKTIDMRHNLLLDTVQTGHGISHHCLDKLNTNLDIDGVCTAFMKCSSKKRVNKVLQQLSVMIQNGKFTQDASLLTPMMILRSRVVGLDIESLTLDDNSKKGPSGAFKSEMSLLAIADEIIPIFRTYLMSNKEKSGAVTVCKGDISEKVAVTYKPALGGYDCLIPISLLYATSSGMISFYTDYKFPEICGTMCEAFKLLLNSPSFKKNQGKASGLKRQLFKEALVLLTKEASLEMCAIKVIVTENAGKLSIYSMYPVAKGFWSNATTDK